VLTSLGLPWDPAVLAHHTAHRRALASPAKRRLHDRHPHPIPAKVRAHPRMIRYPEDMELHRARTHHQRPPTLAVRDPVLAGLIDDIRRRVADPRVRQRVERAVIAAFAPTPTSAENAPPSPISQIRTG